MALTHKYQRIPLDSIVIDRDDRQRKTINVADLIPSIKLRGVIQPIIVEQLPDGHFRLIAGERRLTASRQLNLPSIPARLSSDLDPVEAQIIELEENIKRESLPWQDECRAMLRIHKLYSGLEPGWTQQQSADMVGIARTTFTIQLRVAEELARNPALEQAQGYRAAYNTIARREERAADDAMNDLLAEVDTPPSPPAGVQIVPLSNPAVLHSTIAEAVGEPAPLKSPESILNLDFISWSAEYSGPPFSFIHMDFPYGIGLDKSDQANSATWGGYDDSPDTYWTLLHTLAAQRNRLFTYSAHFMFWLSMEYYESTKAFFAKEMPEFDILNIPLVWHKTDNRGILSDPNRRPRNVLEFALMGSRGDRKIVKAVANGYSSPTTKEIHQSEKPEPMLRHFFQLFVDENTRMFDPTCGSGTSLRAAESLGASLVFGLEINPTWAKDANIALRKFRTLRAINKGKP